jgi:hypothetical protein
MICLMTEQKIMKIIVITVFIMIGKCQIKECESVIGCLECEVPNICDACNEGNNFMPVDDNGQCQCP